MQYRNSEYTIVPAENDPKWWRWTVWVGDKPEDGAVYGSWEAAVLVVHAYIDKVEDLREAESALPPQSDVEPPEGPSRSPMEGDWFEE